jgi:hypothetical protein
MGIGLSVGREVGGDNFWVRLPVSAAVAAATALIVFGLLTLIRRLSRKS